MFERFFHRAEKSPQKPPEAVLEEQTKKLEKAEEERGYGKFEKVKSALTLSLGGLMLAGCCAKSPEPAPTSLRDQLAKAAKNADWPYVPQAIETAFGAAEELEKQRIKREEEEKKKAPKKEPKKEVATLPEEPLEIKPERRVIREERIEKRPEPEIIYPTEQGLSKALGGKEVKVIGEGSYLIKLYGNYYRIGKKETLELMKTYYGYMNSPKMHDKRFGRRAQANSEQRREMIDIVINKGEQITKAEAERLKE